MLVGRRHVPGKLDLTLPITTIFVVVAIMSREITLTFCWQLLMPMNCDPVATGILLLVVVTGQACTPGPCTVSGRRPSSSQGGCGPDRVLGVFMPDAWRTDLGSSESVSPMARPIVCVAKRMASFRVVLNCRGSLMNCVGCVECGLSLVSRDDVSPEHALSRVGCAVLSFVAQ